jgi:hypothetical protein
MNYWGMMNGRSSIEMNWRHDWWGTSGRCCAWNRCSWRIITGLTYRRCCSKEDLFWSRLTALTRNLIDGACGPFRPDVHESLRAMEEADLVRFDDLAGLHVHTDPVKMTMQSESNELSGNGVGV